MLPEPGQNMIYLQSRGAPQRSLMKGTSFKRAHEQSTTAKPLFFTNSPSSFDTHCLPTGLLYKIRNKFIQKSREIRTDINKTFVNQTKK